MEFVMNTYKALFLTISILASINAYSQSECSGEVMAPHLECFNREAGPQIHLSIDEFQTCQDDKIIALRRSLIGMHVISSSDKKEIHSIDKENIEIAYSDKRILIDQENRGDNMSFILPTKAILHDDKTIIEMNITSIVAPDYQRADTTHFVGSFKVTNDDGTNEEGELFCYVAR
jgi:hypothetical protein